MTYGWSSHRYPLSENSSTIQTRLYTNVTLADRQIKSLSLRINTEGGLRLYYILHVFQSRLPLGIATQFQLFAAHFDYFLLLAFFDCLSEPTFPGMSQEKNQSKTHG